MKKLVSLILATVMVANMTVAGAVDIGGTLEKCTSNHI